MAKTAAERQAKYRATRCFAGKDGNGERRLNIWISTEASCALDRLARRYCVTKREMIEKLIIDLDTSVLKTFQNADSKEWDQYFNITQ